MHLEITALIKTENSGGGFVIILRLRKIQSTSLTLPSKGDAFEFSLSLIDHSNIAVNIGSDGKV